MGGVKSEGTYGERTDWTCGSGWTEGRSGSDSSDIRGVKWKCLEQEEGKKSGSDTLRNS